jgi:hypothetical protein
VDEAHYYKNLYLHTKMRNVAGISQTEAKKSSDMQAKCQYMDELTGNRGVIFATGTPVSNSMTEIFTMMRYLQRDKLMEMNLRHFDAWASTFGEVTASVELAPEGTGYKARTRFKFNNMPELMRVFKEAADIKTADTLNLERPEAVFENIAVEPSEIQKTLVEKLSERAEAISKGSVDSSEDNMLCVTSDGRKIGLDPRLIDPMYPDEPGSKVNACVNNIHRIWDETKEKRLTQLVFCDFSTPNKDKFNVYDDIRSKLIAKGVLEKEIAYIHDADTQQKKDDLFKKAQSGSVRILMGSTQKMGAGTNVQNRLIAIHDVDCPWRPADLEQRAGRIIRQGNTNERVYVYRYSTKATFDAYLWQTLENKQKLISQVMTSKTPARRCDDVDESVLSYAEVKALCAGNPLIREKMELDVRVTKLKTAKAAHQSNIYELQEKLRNHFPVWIRRAETLIGSLKSDKERAAASEGDKFPGMTLMGKAYDAKEEAAKVLAALCAAAANAPLALGSYRGFEMSVKAEEKSGKKVTEITLKGSASHSVILGESESGSIVRLNNGLNGIAERIARHEEQLGVLRRQAEAAREEIERPFPMEAELKQKTTRLNELNLTLDLGEGNTAPAGPDTVTPEESLSPAPEPSLSLEPGGAAISASDKAASERKRLTESAKRKGVVILTDAQKNRAYSGGVLEAGDVYAVQKISRGMGIIHSFIKAPELRDAIAARGNGKLCIRYGRNGKCSITAIENGQDKETTLGH